jgi:hypothetical protein
VRNSLLAMTLMWPVVVFASRGLGYVEAVLRISGSQVLNAEEQHLYRAIIWILSISLALTGPVIFFVVHWRVRTDRFE